MSRRLDSNFIANFGLAIPLGVLRGYIAITALFWRSGIFGEKQKTLERLPSMINTILYNKAVKLRRSLCNLISLTISDY
jgi:hypothetical protein